MKLNNFIINLNKLCFVRNQSRKNMNKPLTKVDLTFELVKFAHIEIQKLDFTSPLWKNIESATKIGEKTRKGKRCIKETLDQTLLM